jgi:hypothetical protein
MEDTRQAPNNFLRNPSYDECLAHVTFKYILNTIITVGGWRGKYRAFYTLPHNITAILSYITERVNTGTGYLTVSFIRLKKVGPTAIKTYLTCYASPEI